MTSSLSFVLVAFGVAVTLGSVHGALSDEDKNKIRFALMSIVAECSNDGISKGTIKAEAFGNIEPCLLACVFQKIKVIDEKGLYDSNKAVALVKKYISDEYDQNKLMNVIEKCKSVNDEEVSDGEKGCERSRLLFECSLPLYRGEFIQLRR